MKTLKELLSREHHEDFRARQMVLWYGMVELHTNLQMMQQMLTFPQKLLEGGAARFLSYVAGTLFRYSSIIAWRLWSDTDRRALTLPRLASFVLSNLPAESRDEFHAGLEKTVPDAEVVRRLTRARHKMLAHVEDGEAVRNVEHTLGISVADLEHMATRTALYYHAMDPGHITIFPFDGYSDRRIPGSGPLRYLQGLAALHSNYSQVYDEHGEEMWGRLYGHKVNEDELDALNAIRKVHGLPPIDVALLNPNPIR